MPKKPLSVQLYTVRKALAEDLPGTLARVAELGFGNVELYGFVDLVDEYAEALPAAGLAAPSAHAHLFGEDLDGVLDAATRLGVTTVIDPAIERGLWSTRELVADSAARLNRIGVIAAEKGLAVGYHNHAWELEIRIDGAPALEIFADLLAPEIVLEVDTYWAEVGGVPAAALLGRLGDRVRFLHVKDGAVTENDLDQVAVGSGQVDVPAILAAAPDAQAVVELDDFAGDVFDALRDSVTYLAANGQSTGAPA